MIGLVAHMHVAEGKQSEFESLMTALREKVKANEPGVLMYDLFLTKGSTTHYVVMEQYRDAEAVKAHGETEHMREAGAKIVACLTERPDIQRLESVE